jgi:phytanoyl-CoA hydroxylase
MNPNTNIKQLRNDYERDGFVCLPRFLSADELEEVRREIKNYVHDVAPKLEASEVTFEVDGTTARNLWRMEKHSSFFDELSKAPALTQLVRELVHGDPIVLGVETFNKPARIGSGVPPHQDNAYFCQSPPDVLTVWIAMDAVTASNGPVFYAPGSHKLGLLPHKASGVKGNSIGLEGKFDMADPYVGLLEPGDALIHHCQTIHYSGPNRTELPRCGLLVVYRGSHTETNPLLKTAYEKALAQVA